MLSVTGKLSTSYFACKWAHTHIHMSIVTCGSFPGAGSREENLGQFLSGLLLFNLILTMHLPKKGLQ